MRCGVPESREAVEAMTQEFRNESRTEICQRRPRVRNSVVVAGGESLKRCAVDVGRLDAKVSCGNSYAHRCGHGLRADAPALPDALGRLLAVEGALADGADASVRTGRLAYGDACGYQARIPSPRRAAPAPRAALCEA